jgi:hypothetical protein
MDARYYRIFRRATQEEFYNSINDPDDELYDILWDLFERLVIEPGEVFDPDFSDNNQFRYNIDSSATLEFFPDSRYFEKRIDPNPYEDDSDAAGVHLQFSILPTMSCLFSVGLQIWGTGERQAMRSLWTGHRRVLSTLLKRSKPMVAHRLPEKATDSSRSLEELLDSYFSVRDPEGFLSFHYPFAQTDEVDTAQNFMVTMALLYHAIRGYCQDRVDSFDEGYRYMKKFYCGRIPDLPVPLPCVEVAIATDAD